MSKSIEFNTVRGVNNGPSKWITGPEGRSRWFVVLTVILAFVSFFLYAEASSAKARLASEQDGHRRANESEVNARRALSLALLHNDEIRQRIGTRAEEFDFAMKEITAQFKKLQERLDNVMSTINAAVETAKQNGALAPEMEDAQRQLQQV